MPDVEKVIKGLECCLANGHNNCPYKSTDEGIDKVTSCTTYLMQDALALLKAQEPRVMTDAELMEKIRKAPIIQKPAVDAIPVEWIKALTNHSDMFTRGAAKWGAGMLEKGTGGRECLKYALATSQQRENLCG